MKTRHNESDYEIVKRLFDRLIYGNRLRPVVLEEREGKSLAIKRTLTYLPGIRAEIKACQSGKMSYDYRF